MGTCVPDGARIMSGQTSQHIELEKQLASFENKEAAYLLNYGYQGMVSIIDSLVDRNDVIVYDSDSHACILMVSDFISEKGLYILTNNIDNLEKELGRAELIVEKNRWRYIGHYKKEFSVWLATWGN